jgi:hypothetical protein
MPCHSSIFWGGQCIANVIGDITEIHDASVVVVLSGEEGTIELGRMYISEGMIVGVPSPKAKIEAAKGREMIVYDDSLINNNKKSYWHLAMPTGDQYRPFRDVTKALWCLRKQVRQG